MIQTGVIQGLEKAIARYEKKGTNYFAMYCGSDKLPVVNGLNGRWEEMSECVEELKEYFEDITQFYAQYYNNPNAVETQLIDRSRFNYYERDKIENFSGAWYFGDKILKLVKSF